MVQYRVLLYRDGWVVLNFVRECQTRDIVHTNPTASLEIKPRRGKLSHFCFCM